MSDRDDLAVLDELAGSLSEEERDLLDDLEGTMRLQDRPLTHVRCDGENSTIVLPDGSTRAEARFEAMLRQTHRETGPPAA